MTDVIESKSSIMTDVVSNQQLQDGKLLKKKKPFWMMWKSNIDDKKNNSHDIIDEQSHSKVSNSRRPSLKNIFEKSNAKQKECKDDIFEELTPIKRQPKNGRRGSAAKGKLVEYKIDDTENVPVRKYRPGIEYEDPISDEHLKRALSQRLPDIFASLNYFSSKKNKIRC